MEAEIKEPPTEVGGIGILRGGSQRSFLREQLVYRALENDDRALILGKALQIRPQTSALGKQFFVHVTIANYGHHRQVLAWVVVPVGPGVVSEEEIFLVDLPFIRPN